MKAIGFFIVLFLLALAACGPRETSMEITQAQSVIEAARAAQDAAQAAQIAAQGLSDVGRGQIMLAGLLMLGIVLLAGLAAFIVIQNRIWRNSQMTSREIGHWFGNPYPHRKRLSSADAYRHMLDQQLLLTQFLQQSQMEAEESEPPQLPSGWWG